MDAIGVPKAKLGLRKKLMALYKFPKVRTVVLRADETETEPVCIALVFLKYVLNVC